MRTSRERIIETSVRIAELRKEICRLSELQDEVARLEASLDADILPDLDDIPGYDEKTISDFVGGLSSSEPDVEFNQVAAHSEPTPEYAQPSSKIPNWLSEAFKILSPREEKIFRMRSGIQADGAYTFEEIAHHFGVKPERVQEIYAKGRRKLRRHIRESLKTLDFNPFMTGFEAAAGGDPKTEGSGAEKSKISE